MKFIILAMCYLSSVLGYPDHSDLNTIRWNYPADEWHDHSVIFKGKYFQVKLADDSVDSALNVYLDKSLNGKPAFRVSPDGIRGDRETCLYKKTLVQPEISPFVKCGYNQCQEHKGIAKKKDISIFYSTKLIYSESNLDNCPFKMDYVHKSEPAYEKGDDDYLLFRYLSIGKNKEYIEVQSRVGSLYLDIRFCKKDPSRCEEIDIKKSKFENDWDQLNVAIKNKSFEPLNNLIKYLLPCVKSRDEKCVLSYLVNSEDEAIRKIYADLGQKIQTPLLNDSFYEELSTCLDHDRLLPHFLGSKGKSKVCVFLENPFSTSGSRHKGSTKMFPPVYPEGVRRNVSKLELITSP